MMILVCFIAFLFFCFLDDGEVAEWLKAAPC